MNIHNEIKTLHKRCLELEKRMIAVAPGPGEKLTRYAQAWQVVYREVTERIARYRRLLRFPEGKIKTAAWLRLEKKLFSATEERVRFLDGGEPFPPLKYSSEGPEQWLP